MFWSRVLKKFKKGNKEPVFAAVRNDDPEMVKAHALAAETVSDFLEQVQITGEHMCCAKLRFRDPDQSERLGEDRFLYIWLNNVVYHPAERLFSGTFFEVPADLTKWHQVGQRLGFDPEDIFDWMVNDRGHLYGGYTMRVMRNTLPEQEKHAYDQHVGVTWWEPLTQ